ncbi:uncharacterized protein LOC110698912 [Chenopodium quinoa]|uniref:uncharacterized protein LOC110698912 n=1 Tax=Chenopodium quinoa TaxID=63459 RepID=UPI000B78A8C3|nr:uncharacterized protein LOC110698912 [Chenopodium quinoa]
MKKSKAMAVIIGGMVFDIHATASIPATAKTTTPGKVEFMLGGVARNIAECLLKLGTESFMISALGCDLAGDFLLEQWRSAGLPTEGIQRGPDITTASVCNMFDVNGDLTSGVASVESIERCVTPQWIQQFKSIVHSAPLMMVDANLNTDALEASCRMAAAFDVPVWFEPVSVAKSKRVAAIANYITFASPNEHELVAMANSLSNENRFSPIQRDQNKTSVESLFKELKPAIIVLLQKGIKYVLVTLGPDGAFLCSGSGPSDLRECLKSTKVFNGKREIFDMVNSRCSTHQYFCSTPYKGGSRLFAMHFPALPATVGRVSGAGDCLVGGVLASLCAGLDVMQSVAVGVAAAKVAIEVKANVPDIYNLTAVAGTNDADLRLKIWYCKPLSLFGVRSGLGFGKTSMQVGLRLLLSPTGSNVVIRTACCSVGVVLPVYTTFKAIEREDPEEQRKCLVYWAAYGSFTVAEMITDKLVYWFPLYYHMKFAFLVWLQLPSTNGATQLYMNHLRPFLLRHQVKLDQIVGLLYGEMAKFVSVHQAELQFLKKILVNIFEPVNQILRRTPHPNGGGVAAIEGPAEREQDEDVPSEHEN